MNQTDSMLGNKPMSAKQLTDRAKEFEWNPRIGFKYWARAAETIHHQAQVYLREGNFPQAYLVLFRYSVLVLDYLAKHPEAKEPEAKKTLRPLQKRIPKVIETLEILRPQVDDVYDRWVQITAAQKDAAMNRDFAPPASSSPYARHAANDPALSWNYASPADILDAQDHQDLAVDLAREEMRRRRRATGALEDEEYRRRISRQRDGRNYESDRRAPPPYMDDEELRRQMEATRRQLDGSDEHRRYEDEGPARLSTYSYPSIMKSSPLEYEHPPLRDRPGGPRIQPPRPPKEREVDRSPARLPRPDKSFDLERESPILPPPRPGKELAPPSSLPDYSPLPEEPPAVPPKSVSEPYKKRVTFRPAAYLENGDPIRPVFLPSTLRQKFLAIAANNTRQGLEMCGMLCGTTVNNALFISHLVIPEQRCTSDTCETENESGMLDYCITNDLIVIGWIHTHPTQTCFMSSRDLHTQAGYQVMMPESIAIVCAPQYEPSWGIFRLTNPPGLPHILSCQRTETFHHHAVDNLYVEAGHPQGHVYESKTLEFEVCDLRPGN
ncbi:hypothetical protein F5144DRAFT_357176 [Chaetomium tenue]|uniref:Uncharacterized protein n=1 Tax=Chaetomium tenue TaxID=1854479 RepID=A0ACB7NYL6_9PEZI|nr:hypothetical protein F5144DRAFT_357176 [Chaetomium globosum]